MADSIYVRLIQEIRDHKYKDDSVRQSEYILSHSKKIKWMGMLVSLPKSPSKQTIDLLYTILFELNQFVIKDSVLDQLFQYLCEKDKTKLMECVAIKWYSTPDILQQPYYYELQKKLKEGGKILGDYTTNSVYVVYMTGYMIGYFITVRTPETERVIQSDFNMHSTEFGEKLLMHCKRIYPTFIFE
jgi:hypothetical protein